MPVMTRLSYFVGNRSLAQIYDEGWGPVVRDPFATDLTKYVPEGASVLDVGCGIGAVTVHAIPVEWVVGGIETLKYDDATFDVVPSHQAPQYIADPSSRGM
jgi:ubiquinone/menaquinone biosynthesis C-methylase UbiE